MGDYNSEAFLRNNPGGVQARPKAQARANVLQLKLIGQSHPTGLTSNLLKLFEPRPPLEYKPPVEKRKCPPYIGMAQFVSHFAKVGDPEYAPPVQEAETSAQRRARIHKLLLEEGAKKAAEELEKYDPNNDPNISGDPYKTLFVARLNYETTESRIKREFEAYGPIKRVRLITDKVSNKPRGYAFIEYMHTRDMKAAYKQADGKKLDNRRVLVDVERGRTVPNWRPRRLGGGLGTTRVGGEDVNQRHSGREPQQAGPPPRSEETRVRDSRERDREKSRDRGKERERERERSRERSHDRPRDRDSRDDRHHRDRDRNRDKDRDKERDRDRDRERDRDKGRDRERTRERDRDRDGHRDRDRRRDRERDRDKDREVGELDHERGRSRDREYGYDLDEPKHELDRHGERGERNYDIADLEDDHGWHNDGHGRGHYEYDDHHHQGHGQDNRYDRDPDRYDQMEEDNYGFERGGAAEPHDGDDEYRRSKRSISRDYEP